MTGRPSFRVRAGLADPACVSFEAITFPGYYLRQQNFAAYLRATDGTAAFAPQHGLPEAGTHRSAHVPAGVRTPDQLSPDRGYLLHTEVFDGTDAARMT